MSSAAAFATYPSLADKVVLITGGGQGIGASAVEHFALQGSRVAFLDFADEPSEALVRHLALRSPHAPLYLRCDLTDISALNSTIAEISSKLGPPSILINNAANDDRHHFEEVTPAYWDERIAINLRHQFFSAQAVAPAMKAAGAGSIINMSSIAWIIPSSNATVYNMAKAAIVAMTRSLAHELGPFNIRVNAILPGSVLTEKQQRLYMTLEYEQHLMQVQSLKRHVLPEDVARLMLFLAADDSSAITNQTHIIDAGWI
jgi:NAD(P)-dependent dehydrogenase (short-subunit alcohol dehydrogenase family)